MDNDPTTNPELARRNVVLGWSLFGVFVVLFAGTVAVALIYLAVAG
jgi:nitrogen fixation protein FixH